MIKVIKHGQKKFKAICTNCGCEFTYELSDMHPLGGVDCPDCGNYVVHQGFGNNNGGLYYPPNCRGVEKMASDFNEVERLRTTLRQCNTELNSALESLKSQCREIGELKAENEELTKVVSSKVYDLIDNTKEIADAREEWEKQAKIEAVKDFAEELKAKTMCIKEYEDGIRILQTSNKLIDQSVKIFLDELIKEVKE